MTLNPSSECAGLQLSIREILGSYLGTEAAMLMFLVLRRRVRKIEKSYYITFVMSGLSPAVRTEQLGSHWKDFH